MMHTRHIDRLLLNTVCHSNSHRWWWYHIQTVYTLRSCLYCVHKYGHRMYVDLTAKWRELIEWPVQCLKLVTQIWFVYSVLDYLCLLSFLPMGPGIVFRELSTTSTCMEIRWANGTSNLTRAFCPLIICNLLTNAFNSNRMLSTGNGKLFTFVTIVIINRQTKVCSSDFRFNIIVTTCMIEFKPSPLLCKQISSDDAKT